MVTRMAISDARRATEIADACEGIADVRKGLKIKSVEQRLWLKIEAFDGDETGGSINGSALIPPDLAPKIISMVIDVLGDELARLGFDPPKRTPTPTHGEAG